MARKRKAPRWRGPFLRALARTGNVEAAAFSAGVDKSSVYLRRKAEPEFAGRWDVALAKGKAAAEKRPLHRLRRSPSPRNRGADLIVRNSKNGAQLVRAGAGRWSRRIEDCFLEEYAQCGCIRWAARKAGISANIIHYRKRHYPGFAADCAAAEARAKERLHGLVTAAGIASFDPDYAEQELPKVSVAEAIAILRLKGSASAPSGAKPRPMPTIEQVRDDVLRRIAAIRRHRDERR